MNPRLFQAVATGNEATFDNLIEQPIFSKILLGKSPEKNSVLHVAALYKQKNIVKKIFYHINPSLLYHKNWDGDTALHLAAREGCQEIVRLLINYANLKSKKQSIIEEFMQKFYLGNSEKLMGIKNLKKDLAIHDAVRNGHLSVVEELIKEDRKMALLTNSVGESPLFLAVEGKFYDIARFLLANTEKCSHGGRDGMNALHVAVVYLDEDSNSRDSQLQGIDISAASSSGYNSELSDLVKEINGKCAPAVGEKDKFGWTPLHYAAHFGIEEVIELFLNNIDKSIPYKGDKEGMCAFHVAAKNGNVEVMDKLKTICPVIYELLTDNRQTALHVVVKSGKKNAVEYLLKTFGSNSLLNKQDQDGNTPLHLAAMTEHYEILLMLLQDKRVKGNLVNRDGLIAMDIIQSSKKLEVFEKLDIISKMKSIGGFSGMKQQLKFESNMESENMNALLSGDQRQQHQLEKIKGKSFTVEEEIFKEEFGPFMWMFRPFVAPSVSKEAVEMDRLLATIIATVTFAAAFQVPGGYESEGPFHGLPVLRHKALFKLFLIFDALAFGLSSSSIFLHFLASLLGPGSAIFMHVKKDKKKRANLLLQIAQSLTFYSILAIVGTFFSGIYLVAGNSNGIKAAAYVCVAGFLSGPFYIKYFRFLIWYFKFIMRIFRAIDMYLSSL